MMKWSRGIIRSGMPATMLSLALLATGLSGVETQGSWPGAPVKKGSTVLRGDVEAGRQVFNGKGICHYCHGIDGHLEQKPPLSPQTAQIVAGLQPKPSDLRHGKSLKLHQDTKRFQIIREGHLGTGMLPDPTLSDQEIKDVLAFLAKLRGESSPAQSRKP